MLPRGFPFQAQTTLTTNDIVISKLTQILSYLRQGTRNKKLKKKDKGRRGKESSNMILVHIPREWDVFWFAVFPCAMRQWAWRTVIS